MPLQLPLMYVNQSIAFVASESCQFWYPYGHWLETGGGYVEMCCRERTKNPEGDLEDVIPWGIWP
jgi:hypothetical protein